MCYAFDIPNTFSINFMFYSKKANHKSLLVIALFSGNCLKQFHFTKFSDQKSQKYVRNFVFFSF